MATDVSSVTNHFPKPQPGFTTTTSGSVSSGATTVGLNSTGDYSDGDIVVLVVDPTDSDKKQVFTGTIDTGGVQVTGVKWVDGTNQSHASGATVVDLVTAAHIQMMTKGLLVEHEQDGTHALALFNKIYPVGSIYTNASNSTNPGTLLGFGTWTAFGAGRVMVGLDSGQTEFDTAEETGGAKTHTLTTAEMPAHTHAYASTRGNIDWTGGTEEGLDHSVGDGNTTLSAGGGGAHNNLQPYIVVYMWKRTA